MSDAGNDKSGHSAALSWLLLDEAPLRAEVASIFDTTLKDGGYIRNSQRVFAHQPERFVAYTRYGDVVMNTDYSVLDEKEREIIALAVSAFNRCTVCIFSHAAELRRLTGDPVWVEKLALNPHHVELSERERALVRYALKLTASPADIAPSDLNALRTAGLGEAAILELAHLVAYYNLSNRLMTGLGVRPTDQAYFAHRTKE
ncbi:peroxidase-related protein (plasmid) [Rhizobium gallicum]|uniref:Peroxidase-related protein n=2 Tax=Rhizobium TaxID=379 RepID=A0A1L5NRG4_9HYPH|nr:MULTISPECIES: peroxidase-related enzyme [Rhizobium]APO70491.1 peroxidase-related protein [Rhizobium gallicum]TCU33580.1 putative peroxidase-related enzyme [Rhizobium azibense]